MKKQVSKRKQVKTVNKNKTVKTKNNKKKVNKNNKLLIRLLALFKILFNVIKLIGYGIYTIALLFWYHIIDPIVKFFKKYYKHLWNVFILSMLVLNTIFTLRATERNRRNINAQTEAIENLTQIIQEYKTQIDIYKEELDTYKEEQSALQDETQERLNSLNKKVTNRSAVERTATNTLTQPKSELQEYAHNLVINKYGWTENDFTCLVNLWNRESGWNPNAHNSSSGAHGIPQALPASKMASEGDDYYTNGETQIRWGLKYIAGRYGSPSNAWSHFQSKNWY